MIIFGVKTYRVFHALLSRHTCEILQARNCDLFPTIYLISLSENYLKTIEWKLARFLSVKDVDLIQYNLKSVSILVIIIIDYVLGTKTYRVYHVLLYSRQTCEILRARDCDLFPTICLISLSENYSKTIEGKLTGFLSVKDVDLIQSNLKSVSIFNYH